MNDKLKKYIAERPHTFAMQLSAEQLAAADPEKKTISCSFAAHAYIERWYGILVLSFDPAAVNLERWSAGVPYLMNHNTDDQRGIILNGRVENGVLLGDVKFSKNEEGQKLFADITDGIRPWTSVGFTIQESSEIPPESMPEELKNMCLERQCMAFSVTKWTPYEGSSVSVPANPAVGAQMGFFEGEEEQKIFALAEQFGIERYKKQESKQDQPIIHISKEATMPEPKSKDQLAQEKKERKAALLAFGANYKDRIAGGEAAIEKLAEDTVNCFEYESTEKVESLFRGEVFTKVQDKERLETPKTFVGMTDKNKEEYSITKVLRHLTGTLKPGESLGIEKEVHDQILKNGGEQKKQDSILLPFDLFSRQIQYDRELEQLLHENGISIPKRREQFDQTTTTTAGGYLVGTQHRPQDFVEIYRNALIQGITYLPGLQGNVDIPKQTGGSAIAVATAEAAGFSETALVFGQLTLSPKEIGAYIEITRRLLVQSSPAIDNLVAIDLMKSMALKANYLALYGSGGSGEPTGAFLTANIGTFDGAGIGREGALNAMADLGSANVVGTPEWLMNSAMKALLMGRDQTSGFGRYLLGDDGKMVGYNHQVSEQIAANTLALAKLDEIILASFGTMELLYDRNTLSASGGLRIAAYDLIDAGVRHPGAISYASAVS